MQQLVQKLKDGSMQVIESPLPVVASGTLLVQNFYSLISAGTESSTVTAARKGLIGKAKERPQQVKQVVDTLRRQGPVQTYRAVMKKLDALKVQGIEQRAWRMAYRAQKGESMNDAFGVGRSLRY